MRYPFGKWRLVEIHHDWLFSPYKQWILGHRRLGCPKIKILGKDKLQPNYWFTLRIHDLSGKGIQAIVDELLTSTEGKEEGD